jgi:predicted transcriptional regulator
MVASETFSVRLPPETKRELDAYAKETQRSSAFIVKEAIEAHLAERRAYLAAIEEAVSEADATGEFVSWEAARTWMHSWGTSDELPPPEADVFLKKPQ